MLVAVHVVASRLSLTTVYSVEEVRRDGYPQIRVLVFQLPPQPRREFQLREVEEMAVNDTLVIGQLVDLRVDQLIRLIKDQAQFLSQRLGQVAAVVFCQGCPWRCGYCHNPELLDAAAPTAFAWEDVLAFLCQRRDLLDAVVFSGGEPTLQAGLPTALAQARALGYRTALHTGGMYPARLTALLKLLDWVGLDIKAPWARLDALTRSSGSAARVRDSLEALLTSGVSYECRTTWAERLFPMAELRALAQELAALGVTHWALQQCREFPREPAPARADLDRLAAGFRSFVYRPA